MIVEALRTCPKCGEVKPVSDYGYRTGPRSDELNTYCKPCRREAERLGKIRRRKADPLLASATRAAEKYAITRDEALAFLLVPCCQACGGVLDQGDHRVDHCHDLGHVRGVLCHSCNVACAGQQAECIRRLSACIDYLSRDLERQREQV